MHAWSTGNTVEKRFSQTTKNYSWVDYGADVKPLHALTSETRDTIRLEC